MSRSLGREAETFFATGLGCRVALSGLSEGPRTIEMIWGRGEQGGQGDQAKPSTPSLEGGNRQGRGA